MALERTNGKSNSIILDIAATLHNLLEREWSNHVAWITGHSHLYGNIIVDSLAKEACKSDIVHEELGN